MPTVKNGSVVYAAHPEGHIEPDVHLKYIESEIDLESMPLNGGVLLKTIALSSDPYLRYRMRDPNVPHFVPAFDLGMPIENSGIAIVVRSDDPNFKSGDQVSGMLEFSDYSVFPGTRPMALARPLRKVEKIPGHPLSIYTGTLGGAGMTSYQGLKGFASEKVKTSKTLFVSGGAGPVGTFVIEYAKVMAPHLKIIASAGSAAKVEIMKDCGADVAFNYKEQDAEAILSEHGPIDIYWDNVAGPTLDAALINFNSEGLIIACGAISQAAHKDGSVVRHFEEIFQRSLTVKGFLLARGEAAHVLSSFYDEVIPLVKQGKITSREHRYSGLKSAGKALRDVHTGDNTGKAVIIVDEEYL
ncbi:uncharacterized protein PHACADRAFT_110008 [Phanerochaete carnosa HHB-10118-sp]|uniref:Enoyl reductase (ER) domain-containing protein n=1 Tax=Phanerochaete carnosa (strain HHB-10118-sp) TaxID=650164 RepID=K5W995_PHACS|nr:uncharacterized protein PHACADRAFT_110008 [Phanerochaete carnosa HHB-10118-sp]EKM60518.1 hypothetical protein PHACADRAFT_110008 [Phanerochaete carnosa HHB-10118-sp]